MTDVITKVWVNELREIPEFSPVFDGPAIEYRFRMNFRQAPEVHGHPKKVTLLLTHQGTGQKPPVEVALVKPGTTDEVPIERLQFQTTPGSNPTGGTPEPAPTPGPAPVAVGPMEASSDVRGVQFMMARRPVFPGGIRDLDGLLDGGPGIFEPPTPDFDRYEYEIGDEDPNGEWLLRIRNRGFAPALFRVHLFHPGAQLSLAESKIPFSLLNRVLRKINRLVDVRLTIDREATIDFRPEFKHLTGLNKMTYEVGRVYEVPYLGNDVYLKDINLENLSVTLTNLDDDTVGLVAEVDFETEGAEEIDVNNWDDIDIEDLAVAAVLGFAGTQHHVYSEERDLGGNLLSAYAPAGKLELKIQADIHTDAWQSDIRDGVNGKIRDFLAEESTKEALNVMAEHFTDLFMFLATGADDRVFFDLKPTAGDVVVRHYDKPKDRFGFLPFDVAELASMRMANAVAVTDGGQTTDGSGSAGAGSFSFPTARDFSAIGDRLAEWGNRAGSSRKIDHVVVLMLENRSFDHMLGYLTTRKGRTDIDGLTAAPNHTNPVPGSTQEHRIFQLTDGGVVRIDPGHGVEDVTQQVAAGAMSGFVANYMAKSQVRNRPGEERLVMGYYAEDLLDTFDDLADEYLVCDRWFCSHPGPTQPNRFASLMGTMPSTSNVHIDDDLLGAVKGDTIFDLLTEAGVSWKYVESNIAFLRMFDKYRVDESNIVQIGDWLNLARSGQLPAVSWIDPNYGDVDIDELADDDHPPANVVMGQGLVQSVYEALTANEQQWRKTLFVVTYDEHGGFYDHVPPHGFGGEANPVVDKIHPEGATHFGIRVPALVVSPWVKRGSVSSIVFDHTSLLKTILLNFLGSDSVGRGLLGERADAANDLLQLLEATVRTDVPPVSLPPPAPPSSQLLSPTERDSFHLGMRLFGFGPKLRRIVAGRVDE